MSLRALSVLAAERDLTEFVVGWRLESNRCTHEKKCHLGCCEASFVDFLGLGKETNSKVLKYGGDWRLAEGMEGMLAMLPGAYSTNCWFVEVSM